MRGGMFHGLPGRRRLSSRRRRLRLDGFACFFGRGGMRGGMFHGLFLGFALEAVGSHWRGLLLLRVERLDPLQPDVRRNQAVVSGNEHGEAAAPLDLAQNLALLVEDVERHRGRHRHGYLAAAFVRAFFPDGAQDMKRGRFGRPDETGAVAVSAGLRAGFGQARAQPLARQLQEAKGTDPAELNAGAVGLHRFLQPPLDALVITTVLHIDEVDHDEAGKVAQAQLTGDFLGRLKVRLVGGFLDIAPLGGAARVDVDGDQRLGGIDDDIAAGFQMDCRVADVVDLVFHLVAGKQRHAGVAVRLNPRRVARDRRAHEFLGDAVAFLALDQNLVDVAAVEVANRALDQVGFLVDERRRGGLQGAFPDLVPQSDQVLVVALDLGLAAFLDCGAQDDRHAFGDIQVFEDRFQPFAILGVVDPARDAAAPVRVGHEHAVASGQRHISGQRRAFSAALLLCDLDQQDLAAFDDLLNLVVARQIKALAPDLLALVTADGFDPAVLDAALGPVARAGFAGRLRAAVRFAAVSAVRQALGFPAFLQRRLGGRRRLLVGDGNPVVIGVDFVEGQEAVTVAAIVHERRLQRRFDPDDLGQIDIAFEPLLGCGFEIELFETIPADDDDPGFFRVRRIDQHAFDHVNSTTRAPRSDGSVSDSALYLCEAGAPSSPPSASATKGELSTTGAAPAATLAAGRRLQCSSTRPHRPERHAPAPGRHRSCPAKGSGRAAAVPALLREQPTAVVCGG